jgi:glycosyltransferase involved in cell wall biosynthesis
MFVLSKGITNGYDLINNHNFPTEWAAFFAKKRLKIPIVWMCNEPPFWFWHPQERLGLDQFNWPVYELFDRYAVTLVDELLSLSWSAADTVRKAYKRFSTVVRSGVDVEFFRKASGAQFRQKCGLTDDDFVLLQVGTLVYYKRQVDSVEALAHLSRKYANVKLIIDGKGDPEPIKALGQRLGVGDQIFFSNASSDGELAQVYSACDAFVFPSENTWGLAVTEAMAAGKPVVVSNKAGASEIVQNNVTGFVFTHGRPTEIAADLEVMINDQELRERIGNNGYNFVKQNLSWKKYAETMEGIFNRTLDLSG